MPPNKRKRCPNGTQRNPKTGECEEGYVQGRGHTEKKQKTGESDSEDTGVGPVVDRRTRKKAVLAESDSDDDGKSEAAATEDSDDDKSAPVSDRSKTDATGITHLFNTPFIKDSDVTKNTGAKKIPPLGKLHAREYVHADGSTETRFLTDAEWVAAKEKFVTSVALSGLDRKFLISIRREVLGIPDSVPVKDVGAWWFPPKKADRSFWHKVAGGKKGILNVLDSPTMWALVTFDGFSFERCKRGGQGRWTGCFIAACTEFLRDPNDVDRCLSGLHNLTVAATPAVNTRKTLWKNIRALFGEGHKRNATYAFNEKWFEKRFRGDGKYLVDKDVILDVAAVVATRSRVKQRDRINLDLMSIERIIRVVPTYWPDQAIWLALVCGARKTEIVFYSTFRKFSEEDIVSLRRLGKIEKGANTENWIRQINLTKKGRGKYKEEPAVGAPEIYKPLIGGVTVNQFLMVLGECRAGFNEKLEERLDKRPEDITIEEAGMVADPAWTAAFKRTWASNGKMLSFADDVSMTPHNLRAVYGIVSWLTFGKRNSSQTLWIGGVLGHELRDPQATLSYQIINIVEGMTITKPDAEALLRSLLNELKDLKEQLATEIKKAKEHNEKDAVVAMENKAGETIMIPTIKFHKDRAKRTEKLLESLMMMRNNGVPLINRNLRALGIGAKTIKKIKASL